VGKGFFCSHKWIFTTDFPKRRELSAIWHCISVVKSNLSITDILSDGKHLEFHTHCCSCRLQNLLEFFKFKTGQISHKLWGWAGIDVVPWNQTWIKSQSMLIPQQCFAVPGIGDNQLIFFCSTLVIKMNKSFFPSHLVQ